MGFSASPDRLHAQAKSNRWMRYFTVFNRIALAAGFLPSGLVKIMGERFTDLSVNHPLGHYLEVLHSTGYYYTFIGVMQVLAAILLLIPRTATLGAVLYFPMIVNICILSHAVRFDGSLISSPLMVLANVYLLCWDYDKLRFIFPFRHIPAVQPLTKSSNINNRFPLLFFGGVIATVIITGLVVTQIYTIRPRNTLPECQAQCKGHNPDACMGFCDCIHIQGQPLKGCLEEYKNSRK